MASTYFCYSLSLPPILNSQNLNKTQLFKTKHYAPNPFSRSISTFGATKNSSSPSTAVEEALKASQEAMSIENLQSFVNINLGKWNGSFYQFDACGNLLHTVSTKLAVSSYGEDELLSLIQTLYIKQASVSGYDDEEWAEHKIKETNMFTVDKYEGIHLMLTIS